MIPLAIIGRLGTNAIDRAADLNAVAQAVIVLHTPVSYWIVVIVGVVASRWLVRPPENTAQQHDGAIYIASACLFVVALLTYLHVRNQFITIFAELLERSDDLLIMPMLLGSSPIGAALLILSWYYAHPIARRRVGSCSNARAILTSFVPMVLVFVLIGALITFGLFLRLV